MIAIIGLIAILIFLYFIGMKSVHSELIIEASPQQVWDVLMKKEDYREWNQVLVPIKGKFEKGNKLKYQLIQPEGNTIEINMTVAQLIPFRLLNQQGGFPGIFTYDHKYILEPVGNNTRVTIREDFKGIAVLLWNVNWIEQAYRDLNHSLRQYVIN